MKKSAKHAILMIALALGGPGVTGFPTANAEDVFDRDGAGARYRDWYRRFESDYGEFAKSVANYARRNERTSESNAVLRVKINAGFKHSIVPNSRVTQWFVAMVSNSPSFFDAPDSEITGMGPATLTLLRDAAPVGYGGPYAIRSPGPGDKESFAWYIRPHLERTMEDWFNESFDLPPYGVMERNAYPFLNFVEKDGKLFLTAFSSEFGRVLFHVTNGSP